MLNEKRRQNTDCDEYWDTGQCSANEINLKNWQKTVCDERREYICPRREHLKRAFPSDEWFQKGSNLFGIALSGGGIRSATISLGFLEVFNRVNLLKKADYLSTVSGGGYLGGYVHAKLWRQRESDDPFGGLFQGADLKHLRYYRRYLAPGARLRRTLTRTRLVTAFLISTLMNAVWIVSLGTILWFGAQLLAHNVKAQILDTIGIAALVVALCVTIWHYVAHPLRRLMLWSSDVLYALEAFSLTVGVVCLMPRAIRAVHTVENALLGLLIATGVFVLVGFAANPNVLTMHRFYRDRIASTFLGAAGAGSVKIRLHQLTNGTAFRAPYALINTCLNIRDEADDNVRGGVSSDYFLLSPLRCGSELTGYARTKDEPYLALQLATAVAASGAALSPAMGVRTNRIQAFLMTVFNIRLGMWMHNPQKPGRLSTIHWWPQYHIQELFARAGVRNRRVNVSDGGHIENLGVFELLRRRCKLIVALDAGADPDFRFADLENLVRRAREQLGVELNFESFDPVEFIRPSPSRGYSLSHFVVGHIKTIPGSVLGPDYEGLLVYVKSSQRAQIRSVRDFRSRSHDYKRHNPKFPHESTANQFFDEYQWKAYYRLGQFMAGDVLNYKVTDDDWHDEVNLQAQYNLWAGLKADRLESLLRRPRSASKT